MEVILSIHVIPRTPRDEIVGAAGDALRIKLRAPPVEGKANDALIRFLASQLDISRAQFEIIGGKTARRKLVRIRGVSAEKVARLKAPKGF